MSYRVGCDIVHIPRIEKMLSSPASLAHAFTAEELTIKHAKRAEHLAGIFAAKEAIIKAAGIAAGEWRNILISYDPNGRPVVTLNVGKIPHADVSISHDGEYAMAVAIIEVD